MNKLDFEKVKQDCRVQKTGNIQHSVERWVGGGLHSPQTCSDWTLTPSHRQQPHGATEPGAFHVDAYYSWTLFQLPVVFSIPFQSILQI